MVTKMHKIVIELHTHTHTQLDSKNIKENEITRDYYVLKYIKLI